MAAVGVPWLGLGAAAECGVVLDRLAGLASAPERSEWATVVAALVDAIDIVLVCPPQRVGDGRRSPSRRPCPRARRRRCSSSARTSLVYGRRALHGERGAVVGRRSRCRASQVATSDGHRNRAGKRGACPRTTSLWLPGPDGVIATCAEVAAVTPLVRAEAGRAKRCARSCCAVPSGRSWPAGAVPDQPLAGAGTRNRCHPAPVPAGRAFEGATPGLRRREAQGRCPGLDVVAADPARDARAFEPLAVALDVLTPRIEMTRPGTHPVRDAWALASLRRRRRVD